jgi:hypothetical protein
MKSTDRAKFAELLRDVMAFYKQDVSPFALSVWWSACERYELEQVSKALTQHAMDAERGQFPPKPADLVRQLDGTATDRAMLAWGKVMDAMQRVGQYTDVVFDDPAIHAVVEDLGGWPKVCRVELKELSYLQHRFTESHRAYCGKGQFQYPRMLSGDRSPDETFLRHGLPVPKPAVIGGVEQARLVYRGGTSGGKTSISQMAIGATAVAALEHITG